MSKRYQGWFLKALIFLSSVFASFFFRKFRRDGGIGVSKRFFLVQCSISFLSSFADFASFRFSSFSALLSLFSSLKVSWLLQTRCICFFSFFLFLFLLIGSERNWCWFLEKIAGFLSTMPLSLQDFRETFWIDFLKWLLISLLRKIRFLQGVEIYYHVSRVT